MSLKLYFVRHGQSEANLRDSFYDDSGAKLTEKGETQAAEAGVSIKNLGVKFAAIYCSPYERAKSTCKIALRAAGMEGCEFKCDDRLMERQFDGLFGERILREQYIELYDYSSDSPERLGVETLDHLENRARSFVEELKAKYDAGNILVFSHGVLGLAVYTVVYGRPASGSMYDLRLLKNCEMEIFNLK